MYKYKIIKINIGKFVLNNNIIKLPIFIPVATNGFIKFLNLNFLNNLYIKLIIINSIHICVNIGLNFMKIYGHINNLINWKNDLFSDSGGFQIYSFKSIIKKNKVILTDNICFSNLYSLNIQNKIKSSVRMLLDNCVKSLFDIKLIYKSLKISILWNDIRHLKYNIFFSIIHGNISIELRKISLFEIINNVFNFSIGGISVGENKKEFINILNCINFKFYPTYLMGIGKPIDIFQSIIRGYCIFDCVIPTRHSRRFILYTNYGMIKFYHINYIKYTIENYCKCYTCLNYKISYLYNLKLFSEKYLIKCLIIHNLYFYNNMVIILRKYVIINNLYTLFYFFFK